MIALVRCLGVFAIALCVGCGGDDRVTVYAPPDLAGATISIDGKPAGRFEETVRHYRWSGWRNLKKEFSLPPRSETFSKLHLADGRHEVRITKDGFEPIELRFEVSSKSRSIEVPDKVVKTTKVTQQ